MPGQGTALDLACGLGANALLLARAGLTVTAWDIAEVAIDRLTQQATTAGLPIHAEVRDVESHPPAADSFDVIVVSDFLSRPLCPQLHSALRPGGLLFYQTWRADKASPNGPSNPDFLLQNNELITLFRDLRICVYHQLPPATNPQSGDPDRAALIAQKPL